MKSNLFNPDGQLAKSLSRTFDIIALSMCWLICSIPLLTPGLAWTSMYYAIDQYVLEGDPNCIKGFIKSMQENIFSCGCNLRHSYKGASVNSSTS